MRGIISTLLGAGRPRASHDDPISRDPEDERWWGVTGGATSAGVIVTPGQALHVGAVYACVRVISETLAAVPFHMHRRLAGGNSEIAEDHPVADLFRFRPNPWQTAYQFKAQMVAFLLLRGNFLCEIRPGPRGAIDQLWPIHWDRVNRVERLVNGRLRYQIAARDGGIRTLTQDEVWHVRGLSLSDDGVSGLDVIMDAARQAVGAALGAQDYAARFFANDARPPAVVEREGHFPDDETRAKFRDSIQRSQTGANRHKVMILEDGFQFKPISISNEAAQFLETRKYQDVDVARIFRVPPHKIGILDRATFSNIEQQAIEFVSDTMLPWFVNIEQSIWTDLIVAPRAFFPKFNLDGLLRGDLKSRYQAYAIGRNWGWLSANDVRRREDENTIGPDGDLYLQPLNMIPAADEGDPSEQGRRGRGPESFTVKPNGAAAPQGGDDHG